MVEVMMLLLNSRPKGYHIVLHKTSSKQNDRQQGADKSFQSYATVMNRLATNAAIQ